MLSSLVKVSLPSVERKPFTTSDLIDEHGVADEDLLQDEESAEAFKANTLRRMTEAYTKSERKKERFPPTIMTILEHKAIIDSAHLFQEDSDEFEEPEQPNDDEHLLFVRKIRHPPRDLELVGDREKEFLDKGDVDDTLKLSDAQRQRRDTLLPIIKQGRASLISQEYANKLLDRLPVVFFWETEPEIKMEYFETLSTDAMHFSERIKHKIKAVVRTKMERKSPVKETCKDEDPKSPRKEVHMDRTMFDKGYFARSKRSYYGLTLKAKETMMKPTTERTPAELNELMRLFNSMEVFNRYSTTTKERLAKVAEYENYDCDRVLIREGHKAQEFYFVLNGSVNVYISQAAPTGEIRQQLAGIMREGTSFGEMELIYNLKRHNTYIVRENNSEFLRIRKEDFLRVLHSSHEELLRQKLHLLLDLELTKDVKIQLLLQLATVCKLRTFPENTVLLGNTSEFSDHLCYIASGCCSAVREVCVLKTTKATGEISFRLASQKDITLAKMNGFRRSIFIRDRHIEKKLWKLFTFKEGG